MAIWEMKPFVEHGRPKTVDAKDPKWGVFKRKIKMDRAERNVEYDGQAKQKTKMKG